MRGIWLLFIAAVIASFAAGVATGTHWPATSAARPAVIADDDGTAEFNRCLNGTSLKGIMDAQSALANARKSGTVQYPPELAAQHATTK